MQNHGLSIDANHRFLLREWLFIHGQHFLHAPDVFLIQLRHGRGRDAGHPAPPAQIPTSGATA
jgi:hypothetical protein